MELVVVEDYDQLCMLAESIIKDVLEAKPKAKIALATGSTMLGIYKRLIKEKEYFSKAQFFGLDEYCNVPKSKSMYNFIYKRLYSKIKVRKIQTHFLNGNAKDLEKECRDYEKKFNGIDLVVLGIGVNGHIAFNEPGTSFSSKTHITKLTESTKKANKLKGVKKAVTIGLSTITRAKNIMLLASGKKKKKAIHMMLGKISKKVPASILRKHKKVTVIADKEADPN